MKDIPEWLKHQDLDGTFRHPLDPTPRNPVTRCLHNTCSTCHGSGKNEFGQICVHMISCPCPRCTVRF